MKPEPTPRIGPRCCGVGKLRKKGESRRNGGNWFMSGAELSSSSAVSLRPSLVTLMLTTAGPYFSTSPLKSGSAATGAMLAGADKAGVETVGGEMAALAACTDTLSAVVTPIAKAPAIASATAVRLNVLDSISLLLE